uniref:Signal transducer and activator of transcription n=1 Tax=Catharus ustulatus TaxID=91951 RepID=A0A8C3Y201_CATUS
MAQWQEVQSLANTYQEQVHQLYAGSALPMAVRQCLAAWIEDQNWRQAAEPLSSGHARMLFHSLLVLLGECLGSLGSGHEEFMLKHNLRKAQRDLQVRFRQPEGFANLVANLLQEERRILRLGQAGGQVGQGCVPPPHPAGSRGRCPTPRVSLRGPPQNPDPSLLPAAEGRSNDPGYIQELQTLQAKLQNLDRQRREVLAQMQQLLGRSETLQELLREELGGWRVRQQRLCLGGPGDTNLRPLETWFTELGQGLFQLRQLLRALNDLRQKVTYERDPLVAETPLLEQRLQEQLTHLLKSAFVVEQQPSTPNPGKRPLVLRTASKFSTRARLLVRLHDRNHHMEARIHIDRRTAGLARAKAPAARWVWDGGWGLQGGEGPLVVTEELHLITFTLAYAYCGLELELEAQQFFSSPPPAPWPQLAEVLSWQFQSVAERGLSRDNLLMLAEKLLGEDGPAGFSFWAWLDGILGLLQEHLKQLWKDELILGFVSRKQEKKLLKSKRTGTFLLRFSESVLGGVTFTWVEHHEGDPPLPPPAGSPTFHAVDPYTASELVSLALPDIIRDYQMMVEENIPENPLKYLYPNTARDEAFGPYYSQRQEGTKYLNRRLIRPTGLGMLQPQPQSLEPAQVGSGVPNIQGTLHGPPGAVGTVQVLPGGLGMLQVGSGDLGTLLGEQGTVAVGTGTLQPVPGAVEPPQVPEEQGTLPPELELLPGSQDVQELLQGLESGSGTLEMLEVAELMPNMVEPLGENFQLSAGECRGWGGDRAVPWVPSCPLGTELSPWVLSCPLVTALSPWSLSCPLSTVLSPWALPVTVGTELSPGHPAVPHGTALSPGYCPVTLVTELSPGHLAVTLGAELYPMVLSCPLSTVLSPWALPCHPEH